MPDLEPITREEMLLDGEDLTPITREEMFIKRIYDKTQEIPEPVTRHEMFLKKAGEGSGDVTIEQLDVTDNGTYSEQGKAYSPVNVNVVTPLPDNAYLLKEVDGLPSDIATFNDGANLPLKELVVGIEPVQDLHGYDAPWPAGGGKNKLQVTATTLTTQNVTFTVNDDGTITTSGTATGDIDFYVGAYTSTGATYSASGCPSGGAADSTYWMFFGYMGADSGSGVSNKTIASGNNITARIYVKSGVNMNEKVFKPMIEVGSTISTFAPYSNICPISGWTGANVTVADDVDNPTVTHTTTIPFLDSQGNPITVYGGECDVVDGTVKPNIEYDSYNGETLVGRWISDRDVYAEGTTPTIGAQVVDLGAYGSDISVQPTSIKSIDGVNNVWGDCGQILEGEYFSKEA